MGVIRGGDESGCKGFKGVMEMRGCKGADDGRTERQWGFKGVDDKGL